MARYNNKRNAKFLLDTRVNYQMDKLKGIRRPDMKIKLDSDIVMGDEDERAGTSGHYSRRGGGKNNFNNRKQSQPQQQYHGGGGGGGGGGGEGRRRWGKNNNNRKQSQQQHHRGGGGDGRRGGRNKWHPKPQSSDVGRRHDPGPKANETGINFDIEKSTVPVPKRSWFCNDSAQNVVQTFLAEYMRLYDCKREDLANAYAEHATMTLSSSYIKDNFHSSINPSSSSQRLSNYIGESRNLKNYHKGSRKTQLVHVGRNEIIKFLCKLPPSKHEEYVVDMPVALEAFLIFTMNGVFREPLEKNVPRHFTRTFTLVPLHGGFVIVNEMFFVTNPTQEQYKSLSSSSRKVTLHAESVVVTKPLMPLQPTTNVDKLRMFMETSRMNQDWARKCLEENGWDYERSIFVFHELAKAGKIPQEAFHITPF